MTVHDRLSDIHTLRDEVANRPVDEVWELDGSGVRRVGNLEKLGVGDRCCHRAAALRRRESITSTGDDQRRYLDVREQLVGAVTAR